ncbi:MAG: transposase, partial [Treponema sp.]|nr:transposase [Treponema sp.]
MYSIDFMRRAAACKDEGRTFRELKDTFNTRSETYYQWKEKLENGCGGKKIFRERRRKTGKGGLKKALEEKQGAYLHELAVRSGCSAQAVFYALKKLKVTRKKRLLLIAGNQKRDALNLRPR